MNSHDLNAALAKPRKFVMLMSLAIVAYYALGVGVKGEAAYSGFVLTLTRPGYAVYGLWFVWFWSAWRYGQKFYELLSAIWNDILGDVLAEDRRIAVSWGSRRAARAVRQGTFEKARPSARVHRIWVRDPKGDDWKKADDADGATQFFGYWPQRGGGRKYQFEVDFTWLDDGGGAVNEVFDPVMSSRAVRWLRIRAWFHAFLRLPALNDHLSPIALAIVAVASPFVFHASGPIPIFDFS